MPNTFPSYALPAGAGNLPEPSRAVCGQEIAADYWGKVAALTHSTFARANLWRIGQSWPGTAPGAAGACTLGLANGVMTQRWRIPLVSSAHVELMCRAYCVHTLGAGAKLRWRTSAGALIDVNVPPVGAPAWVSGVLALPAVGSYVDVWIEAFDLGAGDEITVWDVSAEVVALASPLAGALVSEPWGPDGTFWPLGATTMGADYPLTAHRLRAMRDDAVGLYYRPRVLYVWAALGDDVVAYVPSVASPQMQRRPNVCLPRLQDSTDPRDSLTVWAYAQQQAAASYVSIAVGEDWSAEVEVSAGAGQVWVTGTLRARQARGVLNGLLVPSRVVPLQVYPSDASSDRPHSTTDVYSVTIWGV